MRLRLPPRLAQLGLLTPDHMANRARAVWLTLVLELREATRRAGLRRRLMGTTPRAAVARLIVVTLVLTPTVLYIVEKAQHRADERTLQALALSEASEAGFLRSSVSVLLDERARLREILLDNGHSVSMGDDVFVKVVATGYSSTVRETDRTPFITASNTPTRDGILALSRDLLKRYTPGAPFDFGDRVHVRGLGEFLVEDSMNSRWNNRIDVWFPSTREAVRFGVREVYLRTVAEDLALPKEPVETVTGM